ncbi:MAG TPA: non-heme iron oxygenase ferredoxin subunit [Candidatus Acidoferrum sp.]|nr:non-heme iron oxygenase ferredoxin subunit [Candidatus Acidoferrum sp.]
MGFVKVLQEKDLAANEMRGVQADGNKILVANISGKYYAIGNVCTHMGCSLSDGKLFGENVECPCHGSNYNVKTGNLVKGPAKKPEPAYQVKVEGGQVLVNV